MTHCHYIQGDTFDQLFCLLLHELDMRPGHICSPRGQKVKENLAVTMELRNPRARLISAPTRKADYGFGVGEFLWYWSGKQDLETILYYNKRASMFSNDGETVNSAYGYRLRKRPVFAGVDWQEHGSGASQWETCVKTLLDDPDSRRAVMLINLPEDEREAVFFGSKDVPCTLSLQFFVRDGKLDLHVLMRSNDVMWGLTYDLFSFTLFQECMLLELRQNEKFRDLELGTYFHTAGSMHLYERHFEQAKQIVDEYTKMGEMRGPMSPLLSLEDLDKVLEMEDLLRTEPRTSIPTTGVDGAAHWMVRQLESHRRKRDQEASGGKE